MRANRIQRRSYNGAAKGSWSSSFLPPLGPQKRSPLAGCCQLRMALVLLLAWLFAMNAMPAVSAAATDLVDGHYEDTTLTRLAFGSCNKQYRNQTLWDQIVAFRPQAFLWLGDAVYVKEQGDNEKNLRNAYTRQLSSPGYQRLLNTGAIIEGVYDDHDMSTNDGHRVNYTPRRQAAYLDFLGHIPAESTRRERFGLYSSHVFGEEPTQVKVLFLDVRSISDSPALILPGNFWPIKPYLLALTRWVAVMLGYTTRFAGDMLGEEQWAWLEAQLKDSKAAAHIIISSVQVLSTNPIVEGWGHYPKAQGRLVALLRKHRPRGLLFLSGDVHFAELLATQQGADGEAREAWEVTSSGMTHTCFATTMGMCEMAVHRYNRHRLTPDSFYGGLNYGTIEFEWDGEGKPEMIVSVRNKKGQAKLQARRKIGAADPAVPLGSPYQLTENQDLLFFLAVALALLTVLLLSVSTVKKLFGSSGSKPKLGGSTGENGSTRNNNGSNGSSRGVYKNGRGRRKKVE